MHLLSIENVYLVEWYDGLVSGIIQAEEGFFFAYLLAFSPDFIKRKYAIVSLTNEEANHIRAVSEKKQIEKLQSLLAEIAPQVRRRYWTELEPIKGEQLPLNSFRRNKIAAPPVFPGIELASSENAIEYWFGD